MELNEKLARWRWPLTDRVVCKAGIKVWRDSISNTPIAECQPFTTSLDACFKWLVPKLGDCSSVGFSLDGENWLALICYDVIKEKSKNVEHHVLKIESIEETPALALCRAIEEIIDKEELNDIE